jgi:Beta-galactosidase, domain 2/Beta-galactosidase jelly roll domain/Beta-galactosidase, domain 3
VLRNPDTKSTFTVVQQANTRSTTPISFSATLITSAGSVTVPNIALNGRQSKILITDYSIGNHTLLYASADIATYGIFDRAVVVFYLQEGQAGQLAFKGQSNLTFQTWGAPTITNIANGDNQAFTWTQAAGSSVVKFSNGVLAYLLDQPSAWKFWAPPTTSNPTIKPNEQIFILGPYLVRNASVEHGVLHISGDNDNATMLEAYIGDTEIQTISWNGQSLSATKTPYGAYTAKIPGAETRTISLPQPTNWMSADSLPEANASYDDSSWTVCNKTSTIAPVAPETLPVLYSSDYGYYAGAKVYRGYFDGKASTSVNVTVSGGLGFGWNAWLNGQLIGGNRGAGSASTSSAVLALPSALLNDTANVLTVVVDYHGHDESSSGQGVRNPRGILAARLLPKGTRTNTGFTRWKIAGAPPSIDPVRGPMNEGGLHAERMGWHLPGFDAKTSVWTASSPSDGLSSAGIRLYRTTFALDLDADLDVPLGVEFSAATGSVARVMFWINGYQYGKYVPHLGPQTRFPVPPGVINNRGNNTIAISLWAQTDAGAKVGVRLFSYGAYQTGFDFNRDWSYLQPGWTDRTQYA